MLVFGGVHKQYPPSSPISIASLTPSWFFSKKCWVKQFLKHLGFRKVVLMTLRIPRRLSLPLLCWCLRIALRCSGVLRNSCQASQANTCIKRIIDYQSQWATPCFWWNLQWWATVVRTTYYPVCVWHPIPMTSCDIISSCGENDSKSLRNCLKLFGDAGVNSDRFFFSARCSRSTRAQAAGGDLALTYLTPTTGSRNFWQDIWNLSGSVQNIEVGKHNPIRIKCSLDLVQSPLSSNAEFICLLSGSVQNIEVGKHNPIRIKCSLDLVQSPLSSNAEFICLLSGSVQNIEVGKHNPIRIKCSLDLVQSPLSSNAEFICLLLDHFFLSYSTWRKVRFRSDMRQLHLPPPLK